MKLVLNSEFAYYMTLESLTALGANEIFNLETYEKDLEIYLSEKYSNSSVPSVEILKTDSENFYISLSSGKLVQNLDFSDFSEIIQKAKAIVDYLNFRFNS